jgi:hypothetical protein
MDNPKLLDGKTALVTGGNRALWSSLAPALINSLSPILLIR